jgi:hypothetical protein
VDDEQVPWWTRPPEPGPGPRDRPSRAGAETSADDRYQDQYSQDQYGQDQYAQDQYAQGQYADPAEAATISYVPSGSRPGEDPYAPPMSPPEPAAEAPVSSIMSPRFFPPQVTPTPYPPEPAEPVEPAPARPVIRRVAVPAPNRADPTETLPVIDESIFATFAGEPEPGSGSGTGTGTADKLGARSLARGLSALRAARSPQPGADGGRPGAPAGGPDGSNGTDGSDGTGGTPHRLPIKLPDGRVMLLASAGGLVVLLIVLVALNFGLAPGGDPNASTSPPRTAVATAQNLPGDSPTGLKTVDDATAAQLLSKAGAGSGGTIVEAWTWKDKNGQNLVASTISPGKNGTQTLRVTHVAKLTEDKPKILRVMTDPNLPSCKGGHSAGAAGFTKSAMIVRDLNSDGYADVTVGWYSRCGAKGTSTEAKLAVISNGDKYILRGQGVIGKSGSGSATPAPKRSSWPVSFRNTADQLYSKFYF